MKHKNTFLIVENIVSQLDSWDITKDYALRYVIQSIESQYVNVSYDDIEDYAINLISIDLFGHGLS